MDGVKNISEKIISDAKAEAESIRAAAKADAEEQRGKLLAEFEREKSAAEEKLQRQIKEIDDGCRYEIERNRKNAHAKAQADFLNKVIDKAKEKIRNLPASEYREFLYELFQKTKGASGGVICFGKDDSAAVSDEFCRKLCSEGGLTRGDDIEGSGFIIKYSGYTENVTVDRVFEEKRSELLSVLSKAIKS